MSRIIKAIAFVVGVFGLAAPSTALAVDTVPAGASFPASAEFSLMTLAFYLMLIIVIPVLFLTVWFAYRFRASNTEAPYREYFEHSTLTEIIVWVVPGLLILALGTLVWTNTHRLDPYRPLDTAVQATPVQAIALDWKWLFIYPEHGIATVNELAFPADRPLALSITSDVALNSFMVPALGGQIYAMAGMETKLHLKAGEAGRFEGRNMQYSGDGFSNQKFKALAMSNESFESWVAAAQNSPNQLTDLEFEALQKKSIDHPVSYYSGAAPNLFQSVLSSHGGVMH